MSNLPEARSAVFDSPSTDTGVDYFDPITIKKGKWTRAEKKYVVVLTWLTYRAIHAELADDLSTDCFIMALQIKGEIFIPLTLIRLEFSVFLFFLGGRSIGRPFHISRRANLTLI